MADDLQGFGKFLNIDETSQTIKQPYIFHYPFLIYFKSV